MCPRKGMWGSFLWDQLSRAQGEEWDLRWKEWDTKRKLIKSQVNCSLWITRWEDRKRKKEGDPFFSYSCPLTLFLGTVSSWRQLRIQKKNPEMTFLSLEGWLCPQRRQHSLLADMFPWYCIQSPQCFLCSLSLRKAGQPGRTGIWFVYWLHRSSGLDFG